MSGWISRRRSERAHIEDLAARLDEVTDDRDDLLLELAASTRRHNHLAATVAELVTAIDTWAATGGMHIAASNRTRIAAQDQLAAAAEHARHTTRAEGPS